MATYVQNNKVENNIYGATTASWKTNRPHHAMCILKHWKAHKWVILNKWYYGGNKKENGDIPNIGSVQHDSCCHITALLHIMKQKILDYLGWCY